MSTQTFEDVNNPKPINQPPSIIGSWRPTDPLELWDYGSGKKKTTIAWNSGASSIASSRKEPCFLYAAQFSRGNSNLLAAGGSGANEAKVFDHEVGGCLSLSCHIYLHSDIQIFKFIYFRYSDVLTSIHLYSHIWFRIQIYIHNIFRYLNML